MDESEEDKLKDQVIELKDDDKLKSQIIDSLLRRIKSKDEQFKKAIKCLMKYASYKHGRYYGPDDIYEDISKDAEGVLKDLGELP